MTGFVKCDCVTLIRAVNSLASFQTRLVSKICIVLLMLPITFNEGEHKQVFFNRSKEIGIIWLQFSNSFYTGMRANKKMVRVFNNIFGHDLKVIYDY